MEFCKVLFERSSFYNILDAKLSNQKIVYVSAHAGWGKTIALMEWVRVRGDARFVSARALPGPESSPKKSSITVIDDLQELTDNEMQESLMPLLAEPTDKQFILISRAELPSLLYPFSLTGQLTILDQNVLCLSRDTVDSYLAQASSPYSVVSSAFLSKESKGYPVAIDCLAELLKAGAPCTEQTAQKATQAVFGYLEQVVFFRFSREAQMFLLKIAQFSEFTLRMAEMISGENDIIQVLDEIMHRGKCIYTTAPESYAIPRLFHRFLVYYQKRKCSDAATGNIWRRAGLYYELCDDIPRALHCFQQVNDWDKLTELLIRHTRRPPYTTCFLELKGYYLALPTAIIEQSPELMCSISMIYSMSLQQEESEYWYDRLACFYRSRSKSDPARKMAMERLSFLRIALPHRGSGKIAKAILDVVNLMQHDGQFIQGISATSGMPSVMHGAKDFCHWSKRDEPLYRIFKKPLELLLGKAGIGVADAGLAESKLERCTLQDMTDVVIHATSAMNQAEHVGTLDVYFAAVASIIRLSIMRGDTISAKRHFDGLEQKAKAEGNTRLIANIQAFGIRLLLLEGKTVEISRWMKEAAPDEVGEFSFLNRYQYMVKVRCYLLQREELAAIALLMRMIPYFEMSEQRYYLMEARMLLGIAQYQMGQNGWNITLEQALETMERYGFIRLAAEEGTALLPLLSDAKVKSPSKLRQSMIREVRRYAQLYPDYLQPPNLPMQPLTQAEKQVLRLLVRGIKNSEIAQELDITIRTVKFHTTNIYAKLNVSSRASAIAISRKLFE